MMEDSLIVRTATAIAVAVVMLAPAPVLGTTRIEVEVVGGGEEVTDWVVEQALDIGTAVGRPWPAFASDQRQITVVEISADGEVLAARSTQVDGGDGPGEVVVSWLIDGKLSPGQARRFRIELDSQHKAPAPVNAIETAEDGAKCVIRNAPWAVTHDANRGGLITQLETDDENGKVTLPLTFSERVYDGEEFNLGNHRALEAKLLSGGPLRAVYELKQAYQGAKGRPATRPMAVYRWTSFAGMPVTRVDATVTQDFAKRWEPLMFLEILIGDAFAAGTITRGITDKWSQPRELSPKNYHHGREWCAIFGPRVLVGVLKTDDNYIHQRSFIRGGYIGWGSSELRRRSYVFWGRGEADVAEVVRWNRILTNPPRVTVHFEPLLRTITSLGKQLAATEAALTRMAASVAGMKLGFARRQAQAGRFDSAEEAYAQAKELIDQTSSTDTVQKAGKVTAGIIAGNAFIENEQVSMVFADKEKGGGLVSILDRASGREFLDADLSAAPLWRVAFRRKREGGATLTNRGVPCKVSVATDERARACELTFDWEDLADGETDDIGDVRVTVSLREGDSLARARIEVVAEHVDYGLNQVVFPAVAGIAPLTPGAAEDYALHTGAAGGVGDVVASPLKSGVSVRVSYPNFGMQFSAVYGGGVGLYFAEEDPDACSKKIDLLPDGARGTLSFQISHPVLDYAGPELVKEYRSPGPFVIGPFKGDWYDACRLYRKWATRSAPWCRNGPIATNADCPKWLADASYWTIGNYFNSEEGIQYEVDKFEFFGLPLGITHAYRYWFPLHQDDRYPEYFPPRLGAAGLKQAVQRLQKMGMRVVYYVNGYCWDSDTESYRTKDVARNGALLNSYGKQVFFRYGGQKHACMCPASELWRQTLLAICTELVDRYRADGIYFDFLNPHNMDCHASGHGHPIGGGNFLSKSVQDLYRLIRTECKRLNPDMMLTGEKIAEPFIGLLDAFYCSSGVDTKAPLFMTVYHDHVIVFGAEERADPVPVNTGRSFILGKQNGWNDLEERYYSNPAYRKKGDYYRMLLQCHDRFARRFLSYGQMLRMPKINGDLPQVRGEAADGYDVPAVEGTAWRAPDGRVGLLLVNYDDETHEFGWELDLKDAGGWDEQTKVRLSRWTVRDGLRPIGDVTGGLLRRRERLEGWGLVGFELGPAE